MVLNGGCVFCGGPRVWDKGNGKTKKMKVGQKGKGGGVSWE